MDPSNSSKPLPTASEIEQMFMHNAEQTFPKECDQRIRESISEYRHFADCDPLSDLHKRYLEKKYDYKTQPVQVWSDPKTRISWPYY